MYMEGMRYNKVERMVLMQDLDHDFTQVDVHDIPLLKKYLSLACYEEANHNIVGFMTWLDAYPLWKLEGEEWLVLLGVHEGELFIYMPLCREKDFEAAIHAAKAVFDRYKMPFVCSCYSEAAAQRVVNILPHTEAKAFRDAADYVYRCDKMRSFSGKKLQKKRNHLNAFYKEYEGRWCYQPLSHKDTDEIIAFLSQWHQEDDDFMLAYEKLGILRVLENWEALGAKGGVIRIDEHIEAFTIGSRLSAQMCQINVEKANDSIRGLYQAIGKEFLSHEFLDAIYVNREDDMGLMPLRQAKESYYPEYMIMKYRIGEVDASH